MRHFGAICPHTGGLSAEDFECYAETLKDAHYMSWQLCTGSRYVKYIYEKAGSDNRWVQRWQEGQSLDET